MLPLKRFQLLVDPFELTLLLLFLVLGVDAPLRIGNGPVGGGTGRPQVLDRVVVARFEGVLPRSVDLGGKGRLLPLGLVPVLP